MSMAQLPAPSSRGGARPNTGGKRKGAGRPPGAKTKKTQLLAEAARDAGVTPIDVMLANMRYYDERAAAFDEQLDELAKNMTPEQIKKGGAETIQLLQLVAKIGEFRMKAQECAVDAAPYVHPRLAALAVKISAGDSKKPPAEITRQMAPQLAADAYADYLANDED